MGKPILCLDFDGVVHSYESGWCGADVCPDPPVPGAIEFIILAMADFEVHIFSSRSHQEGGKAAMQEWLYEHMFAHMKQIYDDSLSERRAKLKVYESIKWPDEKPPAMVTIDDRAICFTGSWPEMEELRNFKPWNK